MESPRKYIEKSPEQSPKSLESLANCTDFSLNVPISPWERSNEALTEYLFNPAATKITKVSER